eukprot:scaffold11441_cov29-Cyclotella_meneghiniana.AAC.1
MSRRGPSGSRGPTAINAIGALWPRTVISVIDEKAPDIAGSEEGGMTEQVLLPSMWNKDGKADAWRLDVDIYEEDELDDEISCRG